MHNRNRLIQESSVGCMMIHYINIMTYVFIFILSDRLIFLCTVHYSTVPSATPMFEMAVRGPNRNRVDLMDIYN
jgi:hypothetical protein